MKSKNHLELAKKQSLCNRNGITIYIHPITNTTGRIDVNNNGTIIKGKKIFPINRQIRKKEENYWDLIKNGYEYFYDKITLR